MRRCRRPGCLLHHRCREEAASVWKSDRCDIAFFAGFDLVFGSRRGLDLCQVLVLIVDQCGLVSLFIADGGQHSEAVKGLNRMFPVGDGVGIDRVGFFSRPEIPGVFPDFLFLQCESVSVRAL